MVRFINKNLKAHNYSSEEKANEIMSAKCLQELADLITFHLRDFEGKTRRLAHLLQKTTIQLKLDSPARLKLWISNTSRQTKDIFLLIELILETYVNNKYLEKNESSYILDFINDVNETFLLNQVPLQIRYFPDKKEFHVEKIISPEVSEKIRETFENFVENKKVFEDFKKSIKEFSSGNYPESIKLCCKSIEDYLCVLLDKKSCQSVVSYYKEVSKKLKIPEDLNSKFIGLINYIHKHRSMDSHGRLENVKVEDIELVNETIIQFTIVILNYLKKKNKNKIETTSKDKIKIVKGEK